jgi:hypothetical protein
MEQNDFELRELLREWKAPEAPASLEARMRRRRPWWKVLVHGYIRVPVPVACGLAILMAGAAWRLTTAPSGNCSAASVAPAADHRAVQRAYTRPANCAGDSSC